MFQIVALSDGAVKIAPVNLGKSTLEAVTQELESLYVDKVLAECCLLYTSPSPRD